VAFPALIQRDTYHDQIHSTGHPLFGTRTSLFHETHSEICKRIHSAATSAAARSPLSARPSLLLHMHANYMYFTHTRSSRCCGGAKSPLLTSTVPKIGRCGGQSVSTPETVSSRAFDLLHTQPPPCVQHTERDALSERALAALYNDIVQAKRKQAAAGVDLVWWGNALLARSTSSAVHGTKLKSKTRAASI